MPLKKSLRDFRGFTLVELLVVIAIIGILSTLLLLQLNTGRAKARDAKRISDVSQMRTAMELYYNDNGYIYPTALSNATVGKYLATGKVPLDPSTAVGYFYAFTSTALAPTKYMLWTELELSNKSALDNDADLDSTGWSGNAFDATPATTEACTAAYNAAARDCVYDIGQNQ